MDRKLTCLVRDIRSFWKDASIYLFGSRANGKARADSDYDLIIVSHKFSGVPFADRAWQVWRRSDAILAADLLCYTPKELEKVRRSSIVVQSALKCAVML